MDAMSGEQFSCMFSVSVKFVQSAFQKFHLLTGSVDVHLMGADDSMMDS